MTMALVAVLSLLAGMAQAGPVVLNETFATGDKAPGRWRLTGGQGAWDTAGGPGGGRSVSVTGDGKGSNAWAIELPAIRPGGLYRLEFMARAEPGTNNGCVISGLEGCNRDYQVGYQWQTYGHVFRVPEGQQTALLRLGQWEAKGTIHFARVRLTEVEPVFTASRGVALGDGERIVRGAYAFDVGLGGSGGNFARPLERATATFNTDRWAFGAGAEVVYHHRLGTSSQSEAQVTTGIGYYSGGVVAVAASTNGTTWTEIGRIEGPSSQTFALPAALLRTRDVWVRLRGENDAKGRCGFQISLYRYNARLNEVALTTAGKTTFLTVNATHPGAAVTVETLGSLLPGNTAARCSVKVDQALRGPATLALTLTPRGAGAQRPAVVQAPVRLRAGQAVEAALPYTMELTGPVHAELTLRRGHERLYSAGTDVTIPEYYSPRPGYRLAKGLWWCEPACKVSPTRPEPRTVAPGGAIRLSGAGRERVAAQLVLAPGAAAGEVTVTATALTGPRGNRIPASAVRLREVAYVPVTTPTDRVGVADDWPDPLPPLSARWRPSSRRNSPIWITITIPAGTAAGEYSGAIQLAGARKTSVPVKLRVYGFSLPERTALRSGFGISSGRIASYHGVEGEGLRQQWELYMRDFAAHRLCPYEPMAFAPIKVDVVGRESADPRVQFDFTAFDASAHHYLDELGFNSFVIGFPGLGGGRYPNYDLGSYAGFQHGTPGYDTVMADYGGKLVAHLKEKGWLGKAYVYWYDEPETNDYPFVTERMEWLRKYAPGLTRMLTEEFQAPLFGHVDLWCPVTPNYAPDPAHARQKLGEEVWWYVCTGPKEPYCTLFIDHPGIEMRMWLWQTWKYQVQGILIWETTWWTSDAQFHGKPQNPWEDAMSYTSEAGGWWGNGDGRFFYPPRERTGKPSEPIDSMRWELLAQGIQDWEYFHLLESLVKRHEARGERSDAVEAARSLLTVPGAICTDMTHFTTDPRLLDAHREKLARAIERLSR